MQSLKQLGSMNCSISGWTAHIPSPARSHRICCATSASAPCPGVYPELPIRHRNVLIWWWASLGAIPTRAADPTVTKFKHFDIILAVKNKKSPRNPISRYFPRFLYSTRTCKRLDPKISKRNQNFQKQKNPRHEPRLKSSNLQYLFITRKIEWVRAFQSFPFDSLQGVVIYYSAFEFRSSLYAGKW